MGGSTPEITSEQGLLHDARPPRRCELWPRQRLQLHVVNLLPRRGLQFKPSGATESQTVQPADSCAKEQRLPTPSAAAVVQSLETTPYIRTKQWLLYDAIAWSSSPTVAIAWAPPVLE